MIAQYKTLIFDCDGVVLNSNKIKTQAFFDAVKHFGEESAVALVNYHKVNGGISRYTKIEFFITQILKKDFDESLNLDLLQRFKEAVKTGLMTCEVAEGLEKLKQQNPNITWLIVSGGDQVELQELFEARDLTHYFKGGIFGSPETKESILERELAKNNIMRPALFLGDSKYDFQASQTADLDFLFLTEWSEVKNCEAWCAENKISNIRNLSSLVI